MTLDLHPRTLRSNIWRGLLCATDTEIHEGMHFYEGAHGICKLFAALYQSTAQPITISQVAGIYAALSPLNPWDTNVANILDILRDWSAARVNTPDINLHKALQIRCGAEPLTVLSGRKVRSFYRAIADPSDHSPIPVDRHLICLALGRKITSNQQLRAFASNRELYTKIESAYDYLGRREGLGNRLASIAWFVQRRIQNDQHPFYHHDSPVCCSRPMQSMGAKRFYCPECKWTRSRSLLPRSKRYPLPSPILTDSPVKRSLLSCDSRGHIIIYLGTAHPLARSGGVNYLSRYVVESHLGHRLHTAEHVHHVNGKLADCRLSNLEVWLAERHGRYHAHTQLLYMFRDRQGRFVPSKVPDFATQVQDAQFDCYPLAHNELETVDRIPF